VTVPTRQGWLALAGGLVAIVIGRTFALLELFGVGFAVIALVVIAVLIVQLRPVELRISRKVNPRQIHAGETARVELQAANRARVTSPALELRDPVSGTPGARVELGPLAYGALTRAAYRLPTRQRGQLEIGPLELTRTDVLGLASRTVIAAPVAHVTVLPRWHRLAVPSATAGTGPLTQHLRMRALGREGSEFRSLRDYAPGDDLRRVHWKASARTDGLKVREVETEGLRQLAVVLDLDADAYGIDPSAPSATRPLAVPGQPGGAHDPFERAITAAASVVMSAAMQGREVRFISTAGFELRPTSGHLDDALEYLALARTTGRTPVDATVGALGSRMTGGLLVYVSGLIHPARLLTLRRVTGADAAVAIACQAPVPEQIAGVFVADATDDERFLASWARLVGDIPVAEHDERMRAWAAVGAAR
jgi:uncharacterized protein (DUF58 family)